MSTGSDEHHTGFQGEKGMEGLTTDYDPMDEDFDDSILFDFILEGGHTYTSFGSREYMLPNDDFWTLVEAAFHHVIHDLVLDKKPFLGSTAAFEGRVLDIGTGIGLWAIDRWIKRELEPGGLVEFQELLWYPCIQDGGITKPYLGPLAEFFQTLALAFSAVEITLDAPQFLRTGLEESGFKEVCQQEFLIPLGHWPTDPKSKNIGICFHEFLMDAIEPLSSRVLRRGLNYSPSEAQTWVARFKETLEDSSREMIFFQFIVVHGRKSRRSSGSVDPPAGL
ncbi:hypothetical protein Neosp_013446 [[Neocosmospora] mangrovei]